MLKKIRLPSAALLLSPLSAYAVDCDTAAFEAVAADSPHGVTLTSAELVDETGGYCQVEGVIANAEDGESQIRFRLRFPDAAAWNGRFMIGGNGGTAGSFQGRESNTAWRWN